MGRKKGSKNKQPKKSVVNPAIKIKKAPSSEKNQKRTVSIFEDEVEVSQKDSVSSDDDTASGESYESSFIDDSTSAVVV